MSDPEWRCFASGCSERQLASEHAALMHESAYHDGAQTVWLVRPRPDGCGWEAVESA